eukprot:7378077-Prymnesium_polylepis.1
MAPAKETPAGTELMPAVVKYLLEQARPSRTPQRLLPPRFPLRRNFWPRKDRQGAQEGGVAAQGDARAGRQVNLLPRLRAKSARAGAVPGGTGRSV